MGSENVLPVLCARVPKEPYWKKDEEVHQMVFQVLAKSKVSIE